MKQAFELYKTLLAQGVAREIARIVLPLSIYTRLFATVTLHNLMLWSRLRLHPHAQKEIRVYAEAVMDLVAPLVPVSIAAFANEIGYNFMDRVSA
jgi:thymidylate synthase (FAD)